ncbi:Nn.00g051040.m01.CDS01 [Neocucurbitaria sp. VM-36]
MPLSATEDTEVTTSQHHNVFSDGRQKIDGHGERLYMKDTYLESSDYVTTPQCLLRWETDANSTYTVVIDQDDLPPSLYTFSLSAFSNSPIVLEPATQKYHQQKIVEGAWTRQSAGGNTSSAKYFENPQYALEVRQRGPLAILLTSINQHPLHLKPAATYWRPLVSIGRILIQELADLYVKVVFITM